MGRFYKNTGGPFGAILALLGFAVGMLALIGAIVGLLSFVGWIGGRGETIMNGKAQRFTDCLPNCMFCGSRRVRLRSRTTVLMPERSL